MRLLAAVEAFDKEPVEPPDIPARLDELNPDAIRLALELAWSIRF